MQSEIEETNLLRSSIARFSAENDKIKAENNKIKAENDKIRVENTELKARIAKLEDKQTQNELIKNLLSVSQKLLTWPVTSLVTILQNGVEPNQSPIRCDAIRDIGA